MIFASRYLESRELIDQFLELSVSHHKLIDEYEPGPLDFYLDKSKAEQRLVDLEQYRLFIERLKEYALKIKSETEVDYDLFNQIFKTGECTSQRLCIILSVTHELLFTIFVRIYNLHQISWNLQILGSVNHYRFLLKNAEEPIRKLGFIINPNAKKVYGEHLYEYINNDKILLKFVHQGPEPPEVWLSRQEFPNVQVKDVEKYFDTEALILNKYSYGNWIYLNYSCFDYYYEVLSKYLPAITDLGDFVKIIRENIYKSN